MNVNDAIAYLKIVTPLGGPTVKRQAAGAPVLTALNDELLVAYLVDVGDHFEYVNQRHIDEAGLSQSELHAIGLKNLGELAEGRAEIHRAGCVYAVMLDGNFEASLFLLDEFWDEWIRNAIDQEFAAAGRFVAAAPARDVLAFGDSGSPAARADLQSVIDRVFPDGDHLLSRRIYIRRGKSWTPVSNGSLV